jgi:hypothetical protein
MEKITMRAANQMAKKPTITESLGRRVKIESLLTRGYIDNAMVRNLRNAPFKMGDQRLWVIGLGDAKNKVK